MYPKTLRLLLPCLGLGLLLAAPPVGAVELSHERRGAASRPASPAVASPASPAVALLVAAWTYLTQAGLLPTLQPSAPPPDDTPFSAESDQGATLDPNGVPL